MGKKIILAICICICFIVFSNEKVNSIELSEREVAVLNNQLNIIGLKSNYSKNIITYIKNLKISEEQIKAITESGEEIENLISDKKSVSDFKISHLLTIYNKTTALAAKLNLSVSFNIINQSITIKDKTNNNLLLKADANDINKYIENIKTSDSEKNINILASAIKENILSKQKKGDAKIILEENPVVYSDTDNRRGNIENSITKNKDKTSNSKNLESNEDYTLPQEKSENFNGGVTVLANDKSEEISNVGYNKVSALVMLLSLGLMIVVFVKVISIRRSNIK